MQKRRIRPLRVSLCRFYVQQGSASAPSRVKAQKCMLPRQKTLEGVPAAGFPVWRLLGAMLYLDAFLQATEPFEFFAHTSRSPAWQISALRAITPLSDDLMCAVKRRLSFAGYRLSTAPGMHKASTYRS